MKRIESVKRGRWTSEEREEFERLLGIHGKEWKKISEILKTRTVVQVRTHAQKYFKKLAKNTGKPVLSTSKKQGLFLPANPEDGLDKSKPKRRSKRETKHVQNLHIHTNFEPVPLSHQVSLDTLNSDYSYTQGNTLRTIPISILGLPAINAKQKKVFENSGRRRSRRLSRKWSTVTPRTMAAATILAAPHLRKSSEDVDELEGNLDWAVATLSDTKDLKAKAFKTRKKAKKAY